MNAGPIAFLVGDFVGSVIDFLIIALMVIPYSRIHDERGHFQKDLIFFLDFIQPALKKIYEISVIPAPTLSGQLTISQRETVQTSR
jgi:hypothetical protein